MAKRILCAITAAILPIILTILGSEVLKIVSYESARTFHPLPSQLTQILVPLISVILLCILHNLLKNNLGQGMILGAIVVGFLLPILYLILWYTGVIFSDAEFLALVGITCGFYLYWIFEAIIYRRKIHRA